MANDKTYTIYSHSDADGGIAAALFSKFINDKYAKNGWNIEIQPVNHVSSLGEWSLMEIKWPCSILDFTLHPSLLSERFFANKYALEKKGESNKSVPDCYWIDHHPTGSSFPFLSELNTAEILPNVITKWDTTAISTPGLLRTHQQELGLPIKLIKEYEEFIDFAEIIDGALYATCEAAHDFSSTAVKLQVLFNPGHPAIDKSVLYKRIVRQIVKSASIEDLFDSDFIYSAIFNFEEQIFNKQLRLYKKNTRLKGKVAFSNFSESREFAGMGRFIPYMLFGEAQYALHIMPSFNKGSSSLSCGINPWNKPKEASKHLGNYFAKNFSGGGHAFVAGGKVMRHEFSKIEQLLEYLNE
ncbi:hypothetical protein [Fluviispira multicolorata]|uniref:Phosphoesterase n=1 Tax=Fluviispira multicolorata TaxID=2654512 RepID=A0A833JC34_9BACT|nr:hypothetical protein [Fluviispira multicolorata]KAB8029058.1 hypothetical protein GCL57_10990 [Fluviispira multicolorata]